MKKQKFVWKLVEKTCDNRWRSIVNVKNDSKFCLFYEIGKETKPNIGKIFVFRTRQAARNWGGKMGYKILKCSYTGELEIAKYYSSSIYGIEEFWQGNRSCKGDRGVPPGTVFVDSVTPIEFAR